MRSNSGPTANIAYTTVRSIFDTVAGGDVICSSLRRPHTTGAFPLLLWAATHIARFRGGQPSFSGTADLGRPLSVSQVEKGSEISPFPHSTSGTESSNLSRSAIESFSVCDSATDDRNPRLRGRFRTAGGSGERPRFTDNGDLRLTLSACDGPTPIANHRVCSYPGDCTPAHWDSASRRRFGRREIHAPPTSDGLARARS